MATETQILYSPVSSMSSHSSSSGRLSLPRLKTPGNSTLQPYHNNNELSALSCSSIVSQIIGQYIYTPLTAAPESYEAATVEENQLYWDEKQLYWEETKETVEDMIYALDRVLGMAPGSNVGKEEAKEEKKMEVPVVWPEVRVEKQEWPEVKVENQELYWGEQKESVEDMINALNRVIERGSSGTPTSDGYTPLTATAENFRLDIMAEPEVVRMRFCAKEEVVVEVEEEEREEEVPVLQEEKNESPEEISHGLDRSLSTASREIPFALDDVLYNHIQGQGVLPRRQRGVRRGSKVPVSSRLSQLRGLQTGPRKAGTSALYDSPIDWAPIQRLAVRDASEPLSAVSPQSCITDAFTEETRWSSIRNGQRQDGRSGYESYAADNEEDDWETTRSCTETSIDDDEDTTSPCETATNWDGVTVIDDDESVISISIVDGTEDYNDDEYFCDTPTTIIIAPPPPTTAPPPPPTATIPKDTSNEIMSPVISCRINTIANLDFPAYIPSDDRRPSRSTDRSATEIRATPSRSPHQPVARRTPAHPNRAATDPLTISRQAMRQEWTETPPMKLDLAKLEGIPPQLPPRSTTPNSRPGTGTSTGRRESPLPWLASRSASPARSIEEIRKSSVVAGLGGLEAKRTKSPRGWRLW